MSEPASVTLGGTAYPTAEQIAAGLTLTVRWHNRKMILGERTADDMGIVEGINRLVFNTDQLAALGIELERNAEVEVPGYGKTFRLDAHEEPDGPLNDYWSVIEL